MHYQHPTGGAAVAESVCLQMAAMESSLTSGVESSGLRHRYATEEHPTAESSVPYGGRMFMARKKKSDPYYIKIIEGAALFGTLLFAVYAYYYFDHLHFHVTHMYAHLGYPAAQHQVGQRYLHGKGVDKHDGKAMEWFRKAADQGHAHASYNLAVGHLKGMKTDLKPGEAHKLIHHAASKGVKQAHKVLTNVCSKGGCTN